MEIQGVARGRGDPPKTGTTIVGCKFKGGVVLGADGRVTTGIYVYNRASNKIGKLADRIFMGRSGSAPDTEVVADYVRHVLNQIEAERGEAPTVKQAARLTQLINYNNKQLSCAVVVAGCDKEAGPQLFSCPIGGAMQEMEWAVEGSGSTFIWGYCEHSYVADMTEDEAHQMVVTALALAMSRDGGSGGVIRTKVITEGEVRDSYVPGEQVPLFGEEIRQPLRADAMVVG